MRSVEFELSGEVIYWRGPAPFVFVPVPMDIGEEIKGWSSLLTYGWGVIPCEVVLGSTTFATALFPKNGSYLVPLKATVQRAESVEVGQNRNLILRLQIPERYELIPQSDRDVR